MKKIFTLVSMFLISVCYSQKQYEFDYIVQYDTFYEDSIKNENPHFRVSEKSFERYYLINSKQNEYFAIISEKDSLNYKLYFEDHKNKVHSNGIFMKSDLHMAEQISINCRNIWGTRNLLKNSEHDFVKLKDTIIKDESFFHYKYSITNARKRKRKENGTYYFIIDKSSDFTLPIFTRLSIFEKWMSNEEIPKGFIREVSYQDYSGELIYTEKFMGFKKTEKKIYVPVSCGLTEVRFE